MQLLAQLFGLFAAGAVEGKLRKEFLVMNSSKQSVPPVYETGKQKRGIAVILGSFIFCPCHLPLTLGLLAALFGGTVLGAFLLRYSILVGIVTTLIWLVGTWYGFRQMRARTTCALPVRKA